MLWKAGKARRPRPVSERKAQAIAKIKKRLLKKKYNEFRSPILRDSLLTAAVIAPSAFWVIAAGLKPQFVSRHLNAATNTFMLSVSSLVGVAASSAITRHSAGFNNIVVDKAKKNHPLLFREAAAQTPYYWAMQPPKKLLRNNIIPKSYNPKFMTPRYDLLRQKTRMLARSEENRLESLAARTAGQRILDILIQGKENSGKFSEFFKEVSIAWKKARLNDSERKELKALVAKANISMKEAEEMGLLRKIMNFEIFREAPEN